MATPLEKSTLAFGNKVAVWAVTQQFFYCLAHAHVGQGSCSGVFAGALFTVVPNWSSSFTMGK